MSKRSRRPSAANLAPNRFAPKPGPGDLYVRELVSARTGREQRYRNIGEHPLTLAHARGRISDDQFAAGDELRSLCALRAASGRDSTDMAPGAGGAGPRLAFTQTQIDAGRRLERLRFRIKTRDWIILEKFCGEGWSMAEAVRAATLCHPSGVLFRVQEALDELVAARGGAAAKSAEPGRP
ncbi:MAG TPA: hypothetical protein VIY09_00995 [Rhizomicrobium sp.]